VFSAPTRRRHRRLPWLPAPAAALAAVAACGVLAACGGGAAGGTGSGPALTLYSGQHPQTTQALVKAFKLNFAKAEELKRNAQTSKYARQIFQAMRPIFADLVAEVQRSIGFYSSVHRDSRIKRIVALGNTFRLPTLQKYLQQNLQIDVERLDRLDRLEPGATSKPAAIETA